MTENQHTLMYIGIASAVNFLVGLIFGAIPIRRIGSGMGFYSWAGVGFFFWFLVHTLISFPTLVLWILFMTMDSTSVNLFFVIWIMSSWMGIMFGYWIAPILMLIGQFVDKSKKHSYKNYGKMLYS